MEKNTPKTKYQSLTSILKTGSLNEPVNRVLNVTKNKVEHEEKLLEKTQTEYLKATWQKVRHEIEQVAYIYESQRRPAYIDYEMMDTYPIINAALNIVSEQTCTNNEKGQVLNIQSNSPQVKRVLNELFYDRMNIQANILSWTRSLLKTGDTFCYMGLDDEMGITDVKMLPTLDVERIESDVFHRVTTGEVQQTKFRWKKNLTVEFKNFQILHFRLLTDDKRIPYGTSMLEGSRRIWKNLILIEDAMRGIRLLRGHDQRIYYVNTGNIAPDNINSYIQDIMNNVKRRKQVDPNTGAVDLKMSFAAIDQDIVIPIRGANDGTKIDTIAGSSNLSEIADIEYDQNQLFAALGIPKPFLNYGETTGEGKSLAMLDIRFAAKIARIQQALLLEFNKAAMVHLYMLGLKDEMANFSLSMNNPSIQTEVMRLELMQTKMSLYKDAVTDNGKGFSAFSDTKAKKEILGWSDDEILEDFLQQRMEKAASIELQNTQNVIPHTGLFDKVDKIYGNIEAALNPPLNTEDGSSDSPSGGGGGGGGFDFGGGGGDMGDLGGEDELGGAEGEAPPAAEGETPEGEAPAAETTETEPELPTENTWITKPLIVDNLLRKINNLLK